MNQGPRNVSEILARELAAKLAPTIRQALQHGALMGVAMISPNLIGKVLEIAAAQPGIPIIAANSNPAAAPNIAARKNGWGYIRTALKRLLWNPLSKRVEAWGASEAAVHLFANQDSSTFGPHLDIALQEFLTPILEQYLKQDATNLEQHINQLKQTIENFTPQQLIKEIVQSQADKTIPWTLSTQQMTELNNVLIQAPTVDASSTPLENTSSLSDALWAMVTNPVEFFSSHEPQLAKSIQQTFKGWMSSINSSINDILGGEEATNTTNSTKDVAATLNNTASFTQTMAQQAAMQAQKQATQNVLKAATSALNQLKEKEMKALNELEQNLNQAANNALRCSSGDTTCEKMAAQAGKAGHFMAEQGQEWVRWTLNSPQRAVEGVKDVADYTMDQYSIFLEKGKYCVHTLTDLAQDTQQYCKDHPYFAAGVGLLAFTGLVGGCLGYRSWAHASASANAQAHAQANVETKASQEQTQNSKNEIHNHNDSAEGISKILLPFWHMLQTQQQMISNLVGRQQPPASLPSLADSAAANANYDVATNAGKTKKLN